MSKIIFLILLCMSAPSFSKTALQYARDVEDSVDSDSSDFRAVKKYTDSAINGALTRAVSKLTEKGEWELAEKINYEWTVTYQKSMFYYSKNIGDHPPISVWLAATYEAIELALGFDTCKLLHISDIKTLNSGIPVVIHPCTFPMGSVAGERIDEYRRHFDGGPLGDDKYYGVAPVLVYWVVDIGCSVAGVTAPVCPILASVAERVMNIAGVFLSDRIYKKHCEQN